MLTKNISSLVSYTNSIKLFLSFIILVNIIFYVAEYFFGDQNGIIETYNISNIINFITIAAFYFSIIIFFYNKINEKIKKNSVFFLVIIINSITFFFFKEYLLIVSITVFYFIFIMMAYYTKKKMKGLWILNVNIFIFLFLFSITEMIFSLILNQPKYYSDYDFRLTRPVPYSNSSYFSELFLNESYGIDYFDLKPDTESSIVLTFPKNRKGKYINIEGNNRVTTNSLKSAKKNIYLYGGSSVFCREVPDSLTIASILQRKFNELNYKVSVKNHGVPGADVREQLERLKYDNILEENDVVIFIDGVNDITRGVYYGKLNGPVPGFNHENSDYFINQLAKLSKFSSFFKYFLIKANSNFEIKEDYINKTINQYLKTIEKTDKYVKIKKGIFLHYLQPNLFSKKIKNEYELFLLSRENIFRKDLGAAFEKSILKVEDKINKLEFSHNMINIFNSIDTSPYLDYCHINEHGNEVMAKLIMDKLIKLMKKD